MAIKQLPNTGDTGWGQPLNDWLTQLGPALKGGFNYSSSNPDTSSWGADETGYTFINTSESRMKRWNGSGWDVLLGGTTSGNDDFPPGTITPYGRLVAPTGWLLCRGQQASRTTYSDLFAAIGTKYGAGDGSTTFTLPNLVERMAIGVSTSDGDFSLGSVNGGRSRNFSHNHGNLSHTHSVASAGAHSHTYNSNSGYSDNCFQGHGEITRVCMCTHYHTIQGTTDSGNLTKAHNHSGTSPSTTGASTGNAGSSTLSVLSPYLGLNYIIKT